MLIGYLSGFSQASANEYNDNLENVYLGLKPVWKKDDVPLPIQNDHNGEQRQNATR